MPDLVTQATYARRRGVSRVAVHRRTTTAGGPIPVHGPSKLIDPVEADAVWDATATPVRAANRDAAAPPDPRPPDGQPAPMTGSQLAQARAAALVVDVQTKRLVLEQRRGALISRDRATFKAFSFARTIRDACLTWPARIGPQLAAQFDLDPAQVTVYLEDHVRALLVELASERVEF
jgi:hypothetical protein